MITRRELTEIGHINKPHGHAGEMSVSFSCDLDPADIRFLMMDVDGIFVPFMVTSSRPRGSEAWLVTFEGIDSDTEAAVYTGATVYALTSTLRTLSEDEDDGEEDDDFVGADSLIGYTIVADGKTLGTVADIDMSTLNALFVVDTQKNEKMLIPIADEFVDRVDPETEHIYMSLPTGLLDL